MSSHRKYIIAICALLLTACYAAAAAHAQAPAQDEKAWIHHEIVITLSPDEHQLEATDAVKFPTGYPVGGDAVFFTLHKDLDVTCSTAGVEP